MFNRPIVNFLFDHHFTRAVFKSTLQDYGDISTYSKSQVTDLLTYIFRSYLEPDFKGLKINPRKLLAKAPQTFILNMPHYYIIADFFKAAFKNKLIREAYPDLSAMNEAELMSHIIRDSLIPVIVEFLDLKTMTVDRQKLFDTSYKFNVDIFGALTSYMSYISKFNDKLVVFKKIDNTERLQLEIFNMAMKFMYSPDVGLKPYNVSEVLDSLKNLERVVTGLEPVKKVIKVKSKSVKAVRVKPASVKPASVKKPVTNTKKRKRCPNGTRKDKKTGECVPK
jgi:hypothetical protein